MRPLQYCGALVALVVSFSSSATALDDLSDSEITQISTTKQSFFGPSAFSSLCGCVLLSMRASGEVFWPGSNTYQVETTSKYWSATTWNQPTCVFVPKTAPSVGKGIWAARLCKSQFAIRGGGHMPNAGYAGTGNGILFGLSELKTLSLSDDKTSLFVGPGMRWGDVYTYLAPQGLYALGGRIDKVGVPGLLLGGGLNFFSNKYGFAMDNIKSYECVLATGHTVLVNATNTYQDLFWALHGGSSNFCIVTKFELKTYPIAKMWGGIGTFVGQQNFDTFYNAIVNFTNSGYETKGAGFVDLINFAPGQTDLGIHCGAHEGDDPNPAIFNAYNAITYNPNSTFGILPSTANLAQQLGGVLVGDRHIFRVQSSVNSIDALKIVHETFYTSAKTTLVQTVPSIISCAVAIQGIPATLLEKQALNGVGSNTFGINTNDNYLWYNLNCNWADPADDAAVAAWVKTTGETFSSKFRQANLINNGGREFLYMNDAQAGQDIFAGYEPSLVAKLKEIRDKYDPNGAVFGKNGLSSGGFKL